MSGTGAISTTSRRELSSSFFFPLQGKAPKEIHAILTETLACFLPGRAKDLSAPTVFDRRAESIGLGVVELPTTQESDILVMCVIIDDADFC